MFAARWIPEPNDGRFALLGAILKTINPSEDSYFIAIGPVLVPLLSPRLDSGPYS